MQAACLLHGQEEVMEKTKPSIRAKVEHPFRVVMCLLGHQKVRYTKEREIGGEFSARFTR
jgi:hypothetical protein